jgi:hypothetical protein
MEPRPQALGALLYRVRVYTRQVSAPAGSGGYKRALGRCHFNFSNYEIGVARRRACALTWKQCYGCDQDV